MIEIPSEFISHLEELRRRLLVSIAVFAAASVVCYFFSKPLLDFFTLPLRRFDNVTLVFQKPYEAFLVHVKVSALTGFVVSMPVIFTQAWLFVAPGLYEKEKKIFLPLILVSVGLFLAGMIFSFFVVIPWGLHFLLAFQTQSLKPMLGISPYFSFLVGMLMAFGVLFDFPVAVVGLVRLGVLQTETLAKARRIIIVFIFIAAAILTPSPDPFSQLLLAVPLWILFEISLVLARRIESQKPALS